MLLSPARLEHPAQETAVAVPARYELKYVIPEWQTAAVRRAISPFCVCDPHARQDSGGAYTIWSLYLDTPRLGLYRMSQERQARRFKMRIRSYAGSPSIFLEIKSKDHDVVKKDRASIPAVGWVERLHGTTPADASTAEHSFRERLERYRLVPRLLVRYQREAWLSSIDSYARVTFDRRIVCQPWTDWSLAADDRDWIALDDARSMGGVSRGVVLELKCTSDVPRWLSGLVRSLCLPKSRYSKYCKGIARVADRGSAGELDPT